MAVTERDISNYFRGVPEVGLDGSSGAGTTVNRLSSTSCVDFRYSFVRIRHLGTTKNARYGAWHKCPTALGRPAGRPPPASFHSNGQPSVAVMCSVGSYNIGGPVL